ncbi:hypothetical protein BY996DRAFT_6553467 [Phakopsora pachyrhizi]|nr:hypothetical protein BY996DRAFT_6553467 [Phakopsora pachyrhizi]
MAPIKVIVLPNCSICQDDDSGIDYITTQCGHIFHLACLKDWEQTKRRINQNASCPSCLTDLRHCPSSLDRREPVSQSQNGRSEIEPQGLKDQLNGLREELRKLKRSNTTLKSDLTKEKNLANDRLKSQKITSEASRRIDRPERDDASKRSVTTYLQNVLKGMSEEKSNSESVRLELEKKLLEKSNHLTDAESLIDELKSNRRLSDDLGAFSPLNNTTKRRINPSKDRGRVINLTSSSPSSTMVQLNDRASFGAQPSAESTDSSSLITGIIRNSNGSEERVIFPSLFGDTDADRKIFRGKVSEDSKVLKFKRKSIDGLSDRSSVGLRKSTEVGRKDFEKFLKINPYRKIK